MHGMDKVDEGISHIASILKVNLQIHEIIFTPMIIIEHVNDHGLGKEGNMKCLYLSVFVGNVTEHDGCAMFQALQDAFTIDCIV